MADVALQRTVDMRLELGIYGSTQELLNTNRTWAPGEVLFVMSTGKQYVVAEDDATDHDYTTSAGDKIYDSDLTSDKEYRSLTFTANTPAGGITKAISFLMTTVYDRCWAAWYDSASRLRVGLGYHTNTTGDDVHEAFEIKTSDDPGGGTPDNMETRFSIGTDAADVTATFNSILDLIVNYNGAKQFDLNGSTRTLDLGDGTNLSFKLTAGGRAEFGYNGGQAYYGAVAGKAVRLYSNDLETTPQIELGAAGELLMANLPTSDPTNAGELWNNSGVLTISAG